MSVKKIYGRRAVMEALRSNRSEVEKVILARGGHGSIFQGLQDEAEARGIPVEWLDRRQVEKLAGPSVHQGVIAVLKSQGYAELEDVLESARTNLSEALLVVADEIEDPRNLGAIARCAEGAGAQGLIITSHRSAEITAVAAKASGGAVEHMAVSRIVSLANAIQDIQNAGIWVAGLDAEAGQDLWDLDLNRPLALIVGSEGKGLRRLTRERCEMLIKIPMRGTVQSLNASVAMGIVLFEVQRQRRQKSSVPPPPQQPE
jgi:23S rRNA (guanosine2251-2'-O)-methyltransferase